MIESTGRLKSTWTKTSGLIILKIRSVSQSKTVNSCLFCHKMNEEWVDGNLFDTFSIGRLIVEMYKNTTCESGKNILTISYPRNAMYSKRFHKLLYSIDKVPIKTWSGMARTTNKLWPVNLNGKHMDTRVHHEIFYVWKQKNLWKEPMWAAEKEKKEALIAWEYICFSCVNWSNQLERIKKCTTYI